MNDLSETEVARIFFKETKLNILNQYPHINWKSGIKFLDKISKTISLNWIDNLTYGDVNDLMRRRYAW